MGDPLGIYLHLANSLSQLLLWSRPPTSCDCNCGVTIGIESCSQLVKDVVSHCVETSLVSSFTTTTTGSSRDPWDFSWLWLLLVVFVVGIGIGKFLPALRRVPTSPEAVTRAITESESSPARAELGARLSGCLSMAAARTLDIPELQMLVEFAGDPNGLDFHHRILWYRVDRSTWIISTPDYDVYEEDFDGVTVVPLSRNSEYPGAYVGQMYIPRNQELMRSYLEMKRQADSLAVVRGCSDRPGVASGGDAAETGHWRIADVDSKRFGDIIPASDLADVTKNAILERNGARKRLHCVDGSIFTLEYVLDFDNWSNAKRPGLPGGDAGDLRLLGCTRLASGKRQLCLRACRTRSSQTGPTAGPRR